MRLIKPDRYHLALNYLFVVSTVHIATVDGAVPALHTIFHPASTLYIELPLMCQIWYI